LRARPALGVSVGEQQSHYCDTEQNKTDRAHGSSPSPSFRAANAKGEAAAQPSKPMNSRRCISMTPPKDYAEYSRSAPCIAAKAGTLLSALGQERTSPVTKPMSASPLKADIELHNWHVRFVPKADYRAAARKPLIDRLVAACRLDPRTGWSTARLYVFDAAK
jgi:hypothetical protein